MRLFMSLVSLESKLNLELEIWMFGIDLGIGLEMVDLMDL